MDCNNGCCNGGGRRYDPPFGLMFGRDFDENDRQRSDFDEFGRRRFEFFDFDRHRRHHHHHREFDHFRHDHDRRMY